MKNRKKTEKWKDSWGFSVLALFLASLFVASASIYMAHCVLELSLEREYFQYIWMWKNDKPAYNDGIYKNGRESLFAEKEPYGVWMVFEEEMDEDRDRNDDSDHSSVHFLYDICADDWSEPVCFTGKNLSAYVNRAD